MLHSRMLRYLDEVARCGSIRKAAARLNVASSAINRQIIALEEELGEQIFERMPRRLRLTSTGELVIEHVRQTLKDYQKVSAQLDALKGVQQGRVSIATTLGLAGGPLGQIMARFSDDHPRVQVNVRATYSETIINAVVSGDCDLGFGFNFPQDRSLQTLMTYEVPIGVVVHPEHELAKRGKVSAADVVQYPLILGQPGMSLRNIVDAALGRVAYSARPVIETNSVDMMKQFVVAKRQAVTFLNPLDVALDCEAGQLAYVTLEDSAIKVQSLRVVARAKGILDPVALRLAATLDREISRMLSVTKPQ